MVELGDVQIALGDAAGALSNDRGAVELARQIDDPGTLGEVLAHTSRAFYLHGELQNAKQSLAEALDLTRKINAKSQVVLTMANLGAVLTAQGDLPQARKNLEESLKIRTDIGEISNAAGRRLQLAVLSIEKGKAADAEHAAREVRDEYRKEGHPDGEIDADAVLLRALDAENKSDEANQEAGNAKLLLAKSQNVFNRLAMTIVDAQIRAASCKVDEALQNLSRASRDAAKFGFVPEQLEASPCSRRYRTQFQKDCHWPRRTCGS